MILVLTTLVFLTFLTWIVCVYIDFNDKHPFIFIWLLSIIFIYLPLLIHYKLDIVDIELVISILLFAFISHVFYIFSIPIALVIFNKKKYPIKRAKSKFLVDKISISIMYIGALSVFLLFQLNGIGIEEVLNATFLSKRQLGASSLIILIVSSVVLAQSYYVIRSKNILHISTYIAFFLTIVLFYKSRSILILALLPLIYFLIFYVKEKRYKIMILIVGPIILIAAQLLRALRYQGALSSGIDVDRLFSDFYSNLSNIFIEGDFAVISVYFNIIRDCDSVNWCGNFTLLQSFIGLLTQLQGVKTLEYYLYDYYVLSGVNGSLHPTLFGFLYGDAGGYLGCLFFILLGFIRSYISVFILSTKYFFVFNGFAMYFVLFLTRGSVYNSLVFLVISFIIIAFLNMLDRKKASPGFLNE